MSNLFYDKEEQDSLLIPVEDEQYTVVTGTNEESVMTIDNSQQQDSILVPEATQSVILMETGTTTPKPSVPVGNYVTIDTDQTLTGNKDFAGNLTFHGVTVATLDDIDLSNLVDLTSQQTISGLKIFKDRIGIINSSDGDINLIKHINNNFLITENNGTNILNIDEQLKSMYLYNKKIATEEYVNDKAMEGGSGTVINVGGVEVSTLNFTLDPQTQIDNISENLPKNVSDLTNDTGFITKNVDNLANYYNKNYVDNNFYEKGEVDQRIPTALSHLTNDTGFIDNSVSDLLNYYTKLQTNNLLSGKVDKDSNKVLSTNDYTTAEKNKLASLSNYDDTDIKEDISDRYTKSETDALLLHKVDKTTLNDYYKSTDVDNLLSNKVDTTTLTTNYYNKTQTDDLLDTKASTSSVTNAITESKGYTDTKISELIGGAPETLNTLKEIADAFAEDQEVLDALETAIGNKVDKVAGKGLSSNDYTDTEKTKLASLSNYDDTAIYTEVNKKANKIELDNYYKKTETYDVVEIDGLLNSKVDKVTGKGLSTNDYTTAEKNKLAGLSNYDDTTVKNDISNRYTKTEIDNLLSNKVDEVTGKGLSTNDYTTAEKNKLAGLSNYDDTAIKNSIAGKVDKTTTINSKPLSTNITLTASDVGALPNTTTIPKLYNDFGENTDGAVTQGAITPVLASFEGSINEFYGAFEELGGILDAKYEKPSTGIPKTDLASDVQASLGKADTALQSIPAEYITETELNAKGYASQSDLDEYLPLTGGDMTGAINHTYSGSTDYSKTELSVNGNPIISTVHEDGSKSPTTVNFGSTSSSVNLRGKNTNPKYNNNDLALKSDVITKTSQLENDAGFITTAPEGVALYETTGSNTDGAMTQKATTDELNKKVSKGTTLVGGQLAQYTTSGTLETTGITPTDVMTLSTAQTVGGVKSFNANNHLIATCNTAYSSTTKTASLTGFTSNHFTDGCEIYVKFVNGNTAGSRTSPVTLNVNSAGAKTMVVAESATLGSYNQNINLFGQWANNDVIKFRYDATYSYWVAVENVTQHKLYGFANTTLYSTTGTSETAGMTQKAITDALSGKANTSEIPADYVKYDENTAVDTNVINPNYATKDDIPDISNLIAKVSGATANNLASLNSSGDVVDSGISKSNVALKSNIPDVSKFITSGSLTSLNGTKGKSWGVKLSSGLIFNWGYVTPENSGTAVSFAVPFTTTTYSIGATNYTVNTSQCRALAVYTYNTASFVCKGQWSQNSSGITSGDVTFRWVAIGY